MQIKKRLLTAVIATATITPLATQANGPTVYEKLHLTIDNIDDDATKGDVWYVTSRASRLGFKGSEDLGNNLSAIYKMEFEVDVDGGSANNTSARNQYVGLTSKNLGTLLLGRHDTPYKVITGKDMFSDTIADWNKLGFTAGVKGVVEDIRSTDAILHTQSDTNDDAKNAASLASGSDDWDAISLGIVHKF